MTPLERAYLETKESILSTAIGKVAHLEAYLETNESILSTAIGKIAHLECCRAL